jgi:hypothetical protein
MKLTATFALAAMVALAGLTVSNNASAACSRPAKISIPDGKTASDDAMKAAQAKLAPYAKEMSAYLHCLADEIKSGTAEYDEVSSEWKTQSEAFKNTPAKP